MGLTFLNGLFAVALSAIALPILIHLLNRRRARRVQFSTLEFLDEVSRRRRRRIQIREWLLLALRVLIIALLALAMMRPAVRNVGGGGIGSTTGVVVFDNSFSMQAATRERSLIERARERLGEIIGLFGEGDRMQLIWPTAPPEVVFDGPVADFNRLQVSAVSAPISYAPADHVRALETAFRIAGEAPTLNREVYVVSDFQEGDFEDGFGDPSVPKNVRVYLVPVAGDDIPNVAIAGASAVRAGTQTGASGAIRVTLANYSDAALTAYPVQAFVGGQVAADGNAHVGRDDLATVDFPLSRSLTPDEVVEVRIPEDALSVDDLAYLVQGERQTIRVVIVHGGGPESLRAEPYLRLALDPPGQVGERIFTVQELPLRDLPVQTDLDYDVFVFNNVERLSEGVIGRLRLAHRDGAGLFFILGDRVDLRYYNTAILPAFVDAELDEPAESNGGFFTIKPEIVGHPIFDGFKVGAGEDLSASRFRKVIRARVGSGARVLAVFGELPALIEGPQTLLFTTSTDLRWGSFPTGGSFLPFVHQAVLALATDGVEARQFKAGSPLMLEFPVEGVTGEIRCLRPDGSELPLRQTVRAGRVEVRTDAAPEPGVYRFVAADETIRRVAVHLDVSEGRLHYRDAGAIATSLGGGVRVLTSDEPLQARVLSERHGREIWRELLMIALLLMVLETAIGRARLA
jgi:hypothetical protein